jgi:hypothetical protein
MTRQRLLQIREFCVQGEPFHLRLNDQPVEYNPSVLETLELCSAFLQRGIGNPSAEQLSCSSHLVGQLTPPPARFIGSVHKVLSDPDYAEALPTILKLLTS